MNPRNLDLKKLNSATKYPSIDTYHVIGERGRLQPEVRLPVPPNVTISGTEKIDGANVRIIVIPSERPTYFIGSREEILTFSDDFVCAPTLGIVDAVRDVANHIVAHPEVAERGAQGDVLVIYGEVYGGMLPASKEYRDVKGPNVTGFRVFDVTRANTDSFNRILEKPFTEMSTWREEGNQPFLHVDAVFEFAANLGLNMVPSIPLTGMPPTGVKETHEWLKAQMGDKTRAPLNHSGKPEGLILRSADRSWICKIRFEDYERTLRK